MRRRDFLRTLAVSVPLIGNLKLGDVSDRPPRPNIVFFYSDDQPLRAQGRVDPYFHTPNIDRLSQEGVVFENAFVTTSICCVSRTNLFTGQHMARHGVPDFDTPLSTKQMGQTYSGLLRAAGYRTAFLGKFGIGHPRSAPSELCLPEDQFDEWYGFIQGVSYSQEVDGEKRYVTSVMEEKAISFMRETPKDQPFLLIMALPEPHGQVGPWNYRDPEFELEPPSAPPARPETMTEEARERLPAAILDSRNGVNLKNLEGKYDEYMATVRDYTARTDLAVGRIRSALSELGGEDNTVVIFYSDNGSMWGAHGIAGKWNMYEESIRVPLAIYDPRLPESARGARNQMALSIDLAPTMLAMAGVSIPDAMQGTDLSPILRDPKAKGRADWYYEHDVGSRAKGKPLPRCEGVRTESWKYIRYKNTDPVQEELFDLEADPIEMNDLAADAKYEVKLAELRKRCDDYRTSVK
ncbi:sulfatase-like hydrolase/transferase [bacterium]|nr:sulfatase-like hydrolase/transferase [bacterium]